MDISSADFCKLSLQEVVDLLISEGKGTAVCRGLVDGEMCSLRVELFRDE